MTLEADVECGKKGNAKVSAAASDAHNDSFQDDDRGQKYPANSSSGPSKSSCCACFSFDFPKGEVLGLVFNNVATGSVIAANTFLSTALLHLAREEAGCIPGMPCTNYVHGMHPDSLLTEISWIGALTTAVTLPIIGSIVDYTPHRRHVAIFAAVFLILLNGVQIAISASTWWAMAIVQVVAGFMWFVLRVLTQAYVPELTDDVDKQNKYQSLLACVTFASIVICMVLVTLLSMVPGVDTVWTARIGQIQLIVIGTTTLTYSWGRLMQNKPACDKVPEGRSLWTVGFRKLYLTSRRIAAKYRSVMWFLVSAMFTGAGQLGFGPVLVTVAIALLRMNSTQVGWLTLITVAAGVPGGAVAHWATKKLNPWRSLIGSMLLLAVTSVVAAAVLNSPDRQALAYVFGVFWGIGFSWSIAAEQTLFATIIPSGANAELYGTWYFFSAILSWLPPLVSSLIIESGTSMQWGVATVGFFFFASIIFLLPICGYENALAQVMEEVPAGDGVPSANAVAEIGHSRHSSVRRRSSVALIPQAEALAYVK